MDLPTQSLSLEKVHVGQSFFPAVPVDGWSVQTGHTSASRANVGPRRLPSSRAAALDKKIGEDGYPVSFLWNWVSQFRFGVTVSQSSKQLLCPQDQNQHNLLFPDVDVAVDGVTDRCWYSDYLRSRCLVSPTE